MAEGPCVEFLNTVQKFYNVVGLDKFLSWKESDGRKEFLLIIYDRVSKTMLAKAYGYFSIEKASIELVTLDRYKTGNSREIYYKGLGKVLLYILVCKALEVNYRIRFKADDYDGNLIQYYKDRGFTQAKNTADTRVFDTVPTHADFNSRIAETIAEIKDPSVIEYFKPIWIEPEAKNQGWKIECPICHKQANPMFQSIKHEETCENRNKIADISEKPKGGGAGSKRRKRKTRKATRKNKKQ
jgi:hypothetical protein